ncbi:MAG: FHA domain-containing protein [Jatrophihabitans sp.]|uniref:FHA domain-containing protein n=1 Tax=Jatrophihabitans sp. TaxID=1932789 RepID=UPI003F810DD9
MDATGAAPPRGVLVAGRDAWALLDLPPGDPVVAQCRQLLRDRAEAVDIRAVLTASAAPHWAIVRLDEVGGRVLVRGGATVQVQVGATRASVRSAGRDDVRTQVLPARPNHLDLALPEPHPVIGELAPDADTVACRSAGLTVQAPSVPDASPAGLPTAGPWPPPAPHPPAPPTAAPQATAPQATAPAPARPIPQAAPPPPAAPRPAAPVRADSTQYFADAASLFSTMPAPVIETLPQEAARGADVQAVRCELDHLNPLTNPLCRVCGRPVPPQLPVTVPQPTLGVLRFSTGAVVPLDRSVLVGRDPVDPTPGSGRHLVPVDTPRRDVSRTHVAVSVDGWQVLVTDLGSINGTLVTAPWQQPRRLPAGTPTPIEPGTTVSLADEAGFRYEATP